MSYFLDYLGGGIVSMLATSVLDSGFNLVW